MSKADVHAQSSAKTFGGDPTDYLAIHEYMDSSKAYFGDNRHRAIFHSTAGIYYVQKMFGIDFTAIDRLKEKYNLPDTFVKDLLDLIEHNRNSGVHLKNSDNKKVHVRSIAEQHILEDFRGKFIPTMSDYLNNMKLQLWMDNALGPINQSVRDDTGKTQIKSLRVAID